MESGNPKAELGLVLKALDAAVGAQVTEALILIEGELAGRVLADKSGRLYLGRCRGSGRQPRKQSTCSAQTRVIEATRKAWYPKLPHVSKLRRKS